MLSPSYGITTTTFSIGPSLLVGFTQSPNVVWSQIRHVAGGTLLIGAQGLNHATLLASGAILPAGGAKYEELWGPTGFALAAVGATVTCSVIRGLSQGFSGQY